MRAVGAESSVVAVQRARGLRDATWTAPVRWLQAPVHRRRHLSYWSTLQPRMLSCCGQVKKDTPKTSIISTLSYQHF